MSFQEESKTTECPHYQLSIHVYQNKDQGQVTWKQLEQEEEESSSWMNDVVIDEHDISDAPNTPIHGFRTIEAGQNDPSPVKPKRSTSPTSTIVDVSQSIEEEEEGEQQQQQQQQSSCTLHRSVSWREEVVTDVIYRPRTHSSEKREYYYNASDMQRFRQHYKMQVRAAQDYQKRTRQKGKMVEKDDNKVSSLSTKNVAPSITRQQQQHLYTSPITGLINKVTGYLAMTSPSSQSTNTNGNSGTSVSIGPVAETCVLVDTLYLF